MVDPLKIVVCSLKLVKRLLGVQNSSPIMNTPESPDSPVLNTLGSLDSMVINPMGNLDYPAMNTPGSQLLGVFWTSIWTGLQKNFWQQTDQGVKTPQCINHRGVLTTWCILPRNNFKCFKIFTELFIFWIDSPAKSTPGIRLESLRLCNFVNKNHMSLDR